MADRLQHADRIGIITAYTVSSTGNWIFRFALPLLVLRQTDSAVYSALAYALQYVPVVFVGFFCGVIVDRYDRRRLMVACDSLAAALTIALATALAAGHPPLPIVLAAALAISALSPFYFPAFQRLLVERVAEERWAGMNAWIQGTDSTFSLLGPIVGVAVIAGIGSAGATAADSASFALSAIILVCFVRPWPRTAAGGTDRLGGVLRGIRPDLAAGTRVLLSNRVLLWGTIALTVTNVAVIGIDSNLVFVVSGSTGHISSRLALVFAAQGAGALLGSISAPRIGRHLAAPTVFAWTTAALTASFAEIALVGQVAALIATCVVIGFAASVIVVVWRTHRQQQVEPTFIGRVIAVQRTAGFALSPVGAICGGWLASRHGLGALFATAAAVQAVAWLCVVLAPRDAPPGVPPSGESGQPSTVAASDAAASTG